MYTRSKAVRNTFLRYHFPIDRSFNSFRVSTESTDAGGKGKKHIISVSKPMDRRNGVTSRWTAVNPWLGNERSRAFVESNAHITYPSPLSFSIPNTMIYKRIILYYYYFFLLSTRRKRETRWKFFQIILSCHLEMLIIIAFVPFELIN